MSPGDIDATLTAIEQDLAAGRAVDLSAAGFWGAVGAVKRNPELAERYADRMGIIDRVSFENWALFTVPLWLGTLVMLAGSSVGVGLVSAGYYIDSPWNGLAMLAGLGVLLVTTHGLAHLLVGLAGGIGFTHWFIGVLTRPQPGVKVDYATYLRTTPRNRAWMHASGAIVTKAVPFVVLGSALVAPVPWWATTVILLTGVVQIITDVTLGPKYGDWKKFRREMRYASER